MTDMFRMFAGLSIKADARLVNVAIKDHPVCFCSPLISSTVKFTIVAVLVESFS